MRNGRKLHAPKFELSIGFILLIALVYLIDEQGILFLAMGAALIHEAAHAAAIYLCGGEIEKIHVGIFGAYMRVCKYPILSYKKELIVAAAGPAIGFLAAYLFSILGRSMQNQELLVLAGLNLILSFFNLIPAYPLDGGRILHLLALILFHERAANILTVILTGASAAAVAGLCIYLNLRFGFQLTLSLFCLFILLAFFKSLFVRSPDG